MAKIKGWIKLDKQKSPIQGTDAWRNIRTGQVVLVDKAVNGGWIVLKTTKDNNIVNAAGKGWGFRTKNDAMKWSTQYKKNNP